MKLTAADLPILVEALNIAEADLRYGDPSSFDRSIRMARIAEQLTATLEALTVEVQVTA